MSSPVPSDLLDVGTGGRRWAGERGSAELCPAVPITSCWDAERTDGEKRPQARPGPSQPRPSKSRVQLLRQGPQSQRKLCGSRAGQTRGKGTKALEEEVALRVRVAPGNGGQLGRAG